MKRTFIFPILISLFINQKTFAYSAKEGNVSAFLAPHFFKTDFGGSPSGATSPFHGGVALMAIGDISDHGSLEVGMFHMNKIFFREREGLYLAEETQVMHITMGYRRWWTQSLATSLTFFSAYSMGEIETVHNDFGSINRPDTSASDKVDYGFDLALQKELWTRDRLSIDVDLRYSRSVTAKDHENANHYGILLGIRYFIQSKQKVEGPPP